MDYTGYYEFPFPSSENDPVVKNFFFSLSDDEQLQLLNGSSSYQNFRDRILQHMAAK